ncbi:MAG: TRL-like family protein [Myxococcales bacterium]|nr:TRL-like family protein [Myxococcales bacterium]
MYKLMAVPVVLMALTGCAGIAFQGKGVPLAVFYADATTGVQVTENNIGRKKGEACATSILGLVTTGDASIRAAADAGGIRNISAVDSSIRNILGIVATYCTIVSGTGGADG